jgi:hypothetical protein
MDEDLKAYLDGMKSELRADIEKSETGLLTEFWKWARTADARYRQDHLKVGALDERVTILEDRISELERIRRKRDGGAQ